MNHYFELTQNEVCEIASRFGTINDFGKTFFTDSELYEFAIAMTGANDKKASNIRVAAMKKSTEVNGVEW